MKKIVLLFQCFVVSICAAQTRFYTRPATPVGVQRTLATIAGPNAGWTVTTGYEVFLMAYFYSTTTNTNHTSPPTGGNPPRKILQTQYVSPELMAQTVNGTFTGQFRWRLPSTLTTGQGWVYLRLINPDGTLAAEVGTATTINFPAGGGSSVPTNRSFIPLTLTNVVITGGQRFLIELGWNHSGGSNSSLTAIYADQNNRDLSDLPVDDLSTGNLNPWFEFSQKLRLQTQNLFF